MRFPNSLFFFQNGATKSVGTSTFDGQGHVTAIHLESGEVSEIIIPTPRIKVSLGDIMKRNIFRWLLGMVCFGNIHTGTANTAVMKTDVGLIAAEESSKPFLLNVHNNRIVSGRWLFDRQPIGVHPVHVESFSYRPFRQKFPLGINGHAVNWMPSTFPAMIHSVSAVEGLVIVPLISTHIGGFWDYAIGNKKLPLVEEDTCQWLIFNQTSNEVSVVDTEIISNPLHIVKTVVNNNLLEIYACHVRNLSIVADKCSEEEISPQFDFRKDVICLETHTLLNTMVFSDVCGDFPNIVNESVVLINSLYIDGRNQTIKFFDIETDSVIYEIQLPPLVRDVLFYEGHLLYCTLTDFYIYCLNTDKIVRHVNIPKRSSNFHASIISLSI